MEPEPIRLEDYPQTHEGGVDFVRDIFKSMGGRVMPPARPGKTKLLYMDVQRYSFLMDFENSCLTEHWGVKPHPRGNKRYEDPEWAAMIQSQVYPNHSDVDWYEYVEWVSQGGGDEWFEEEGVDV
jgi:hypothetical protein